MTTTSPTVLHRPQERHSRLIRERGQRGSPVNQYAPFYVWAGDTGMNHFLFGSVFGPRLGESVVSSTRAASAERLLVAQQVVAWVPPRSRRPWLSAPASRTDLGAREWVGLPTGATP